LLGRSGQLSRLFDYLVECSVQGKAPKEIDIDGHHYISQSSGLWRGDPNYKDYGYFSTFAGSNGNRIIVIAGTRDVALANTAEALAHPQSLERLTRQAAGGRDFEALYEVYGMEGTNVDSKLLTTAPLNTAAIWRN
jgi:hypothetical protein